MNQNLKLRVITALIGVPLILGLLMSGGITGVTFLALVISSGMLFEFCRMVFTLPDSQAKTTLALTFNAIIYLLNYGIGSGLSHAFLGLVPVFFFFIIFLIKVPALQVLTSAQTSSEAQTVEVLRKHMQELMALCFGFVYCGWLPLLMVKIREHQNGVEWLLLTLITVWATDTGAYFAGRFFGKRKLFPVVSPKKTIEGALGGLVFAVLIGVVFIHFFLPTASAIEVVFVLAIVSISSQLGDLCESLLKRAVNVKDSGTILPGHGGFLDRFDGVLFALPVMNAYLWVFSGF